MATVPEQQRARRSWGRGRWLLVLGALAVVVAVVVLVVVLTSGGGGGGSGY